MTIPITPEERIIHTRSGTQYQVLTEKGWTTVVTKIFDHNWKGDIKAEMCKAYSDHLRDEEYKRSKLEPYH